MMLFRFTPSGQRRITDLNDLFTGRTAILVGGAPSLKEQPIELLNSRGVLTMAMNNAAIHFQPTLWSSGDDPRCYEPQLLLDPRITKFAPMAHAEQPVEQAPGTPPYKFMPNTYFYGQAPGVPWEEFLAPRTEVPWYSNTLFVSIHILYQLGVRRIILAGSDFGFAKNGSMYAHATQLGNLERKWNLDLYNHQVKELRLLRPVFEQAGLELMDSSKYSRLATVYPHVTLEKAVECALEGFPATMLDPAALPHCSKFAPTDLKEMIAGWPQYRGPIVQPSDAKPVNPTLADRINNTELQQVL